MLIMESSKLGLYFEEFEVGGTIELSLIHI